MPDYAATVDPVTFALLEAVAKAADVVDTRWVVTGASARLMLLEHVYGLPPGRATEDVDFAVNVQDWAHYETLAKRICQDTRFTQDPKQAQRIRHRDGGSWTSFLSGAWSRKAAQSPGRRRAIS